jgi:hypothetical protein
MAGGRWESQATAVMAAIATAFDSDADPANPYDTVFVDPSPEETQRESDMGFQMLAAALREQTQNR